MLKLLNNYLVIWSNIFSRIQLSRYFYGNRNKGASFLWKKTSLLQILTPTVIYRVDEKYFTTPKSKIFLRAFPFSNGKWLQIIWI